MLGMDQLRPPLPDELERIEQKVRRGFLCFLGGLLVLGVIAILYPAWEWVVAVVAAMGVAVIVTRFVIAKNEYARTHRHSN
jgi:hypothetical protein